MGKVGRCMWNTSASAEKAELEKKKVEASILGMLGIRVIGGKLLDKDGTVRKIGYVTGDEIRSEAAVRALLSEFLCTESLRTTAVTKVRSIYNWWSSQVDFAFYESSLLFAYDTEAKDECRINMIGFANCEKITEKAQDLSGYATGVETLLRVMSSLEPF